MSGQTKKEKPEVYALRQDGGGWHFSRRDFLKAAGIGAAAVGIGLNSRFVRPASAADDIYSLCSNSLAHSEEITHLLLSPDGKYLLSRDSGGLMKCWNFQNYALAGSVKNAFKKNAPKVTGYNRSDPVVFSEKFEFYTLPLSNNSSMKSPIVPDTDLSVWTIDQESNICSVQDGALYMNRASDSYTNNQKVCDLEGKVRSIQYLAGSNKFFLQLEKGFAVLDPVSGEQRTFEAPCSYYAVAPGEARVLLGDSSGCRLCSLVDGSVIWEQDLSGLSAAAVTPDGSVGIVSDSAFHVRLISMADGSVLHDKACGVKTDRTPQIAVAKDGSKFAFAVGKSILFFSLPDLKVIGCPVDLDEMKEDTEGIQIKQTDAVTGQTVTVTLPCGSPIPAGAVCVCNCVAGHVCSCDGHVVCTCDTVRAPCSCDGHCSCNTVCTCDSQGGHYWHPN